MFYSKSTGGFYSREIHGNNMPDDVVEITAEVHSALLEGQAQGMVISFNDAGYPILVDPPPLTPEQLQEQVNSEAKSYLISTDWYVARYAETGVDIPQEVKDLRADARLKVLHTHE